VQLPRRAIAIGLLGALETFDDVLTNANCGARESCLKKKRNGDLGKRLKKRVDPGNKRILVDCRSCLNQLKSINAALYPALAAYLRLKPEWLDLEGDA